MVCKIADFGLSRRVRTENNVGDCYRRHPTSKRVRRLGSRCRKNVLHLALPFCTRLQRAKLHCDGHR